jgi:hypothetical protein
MRDRLPDKHDLHQIIVIIAGLMLIAGSGGYTYQALGDTGLFATLVTVTGTAATTVGFLYYGTHQQRGDHDRPTA